MKAVIWSITSCPHCNNVKKLLESEGYQVEMRVIDNDSGWTVDHFEKAVPGADSVPQIFIDEQYIETTEQLYKFLSEHKN